MEADLNKNLNEIESDGDQKDPRRRNKWLIICLIIIIVMMLPSFYFSILCTI